MLLYTKRFLYFMVMELHYIAKGFQNCSLLCKWNCIMILELDYVLILHVSYCNRIAFHYNNGISLLYDKGIAVCDNNGMASLVTDYFTTMALYCIMIMNCIIL